MDEKLATSSVFELWKR